MSDRATEAAALDDAIAARIARGDAAATDTAGFDALALRLFRHQYAWNAPYRRLCDARGATPESVRDVAAIPACPTDAFKEFEIVSFPVTDAVAVYESSGTTGERPSRHFLPTLRLYEAALLGSFAWHVLPDADSMRMLVLAPHRVETPRSSLAHMLDLVWRWHGMRDSTWPIRAGVLDVDTALGALRAAESSGEPLAVLGTAFAFVHLCDALAERGVRANLPMGSRAMETGGYKGRSRELTREALHALIEERLGIPEPMIENEYGMTELGSQAYHGCIRAALGLGGSGTRFHRPAPWVRTTVVDPADPSRPAVGEGLLAHLDLVNRGSVAHVLTADIGVAVTEGGTRGFRVLRRAAGAELRGCSLPLESLRRA